MAYDEIMDFPHHFKDYFHPEKLHQINVSFAVSDLAKHLGGITTNIAYALRNTIDHLKGNATIYPVAAVGRDGGELLEFFKKNNIDTSFVQQDAKLYTATGKVITDKNDNQIWGFYYGAAKLNPKLETLNPKQILNSKSENKEEFWIVSATHEKPFTKVLQYVIKNRLPYMFDPGMTLTWIRDDLLRKGVLNATYVVGNDYEIAMIEKRLKMTVREMVEARVNVITTLGEKGVRLDFAVDSKDPSHLFRHITVKVCKVKKVVDPTGAGDAWRGGFVGALAAGKTVKECLVMGNVMASFAVESVGTVEYKVNSGEIEKRIKSITKV